MSRVFKLIATLTVAGALIAAAPSHQRALAHHSRMHWLSEVHHAGTVREARRDWWLNQTTIHGNYRFDAVTTHTTDWFCIRLHEEGMAMAPANEFGFVPYAGGMSADQQSALALSIFHLNGDHFGPSAWTTAASCGLY